MPKQFLKGIDRAGLRRRHPLRPALRRAGRPAPGFRAEPAGLGRHALPGQRAQFRLRLVAGARGLGPAPARHPRVIGTRFAGIFADNAANNGLLLISLAPSTWRSWPRGRRSRTQPPHHRPARAGRRPAGRPRHSLRDPAHAQGGPRPRPRRDQHHPRGGRDDQGLRGGAPRRASLARLRRIRDDDATSRERPEPLPVRVCSRGRSGRRPAAAHPRGRVAGRRSNCRSCCFHGLRRPTPPGTPVAPQIAAAEGHPRRGHGPAGIRGQREARPPPPTMRPTPNARWRPMPAR